MAIDIQAEIINQAGKNFADEIDFEILAGMLEGIGWHRVQLGNLWFNNGAVNILNWCEQNIKHPYEHRGSSFVFENKGDAVNFTLRWV